MKIKKISILKIICINKIYLNNNLNYIENSFCPHICGVSTPADITFVTDCFHTFICSCCDIFVLNTRYSLLVTIIIPINVPPLDYNLYKQYIHEY